MKIKKVLIANRGEITCRIARSLKNKGITTVAVYSDGDKGAIHTLACDEAYGIGPDPAANSYLNQEKILAVAKACGADAIHPGYGFLSENFQFAKKCEDSGLLFIGPTSESIKSMGLKDQAKEIASKAGVPTIPGYQSSAQDNKSLEKAARELGVPLLIKAVAGGGGKGMVVVENLNDFQKSLERAQREALAAFSNADVMLEKYFPESKHIEVQVFGDGKGNAVHLFERECSMQRRHQKVIEEAPSPSLQEAERERICASAVALAKAVKYCNAGTVEFIFDMKSRQFYFLEMNTRLQVEHPVTEMITGLDLVDWQIVVAEKGELPLSQEKILINGHAVEARLYAEDPAQNFLPSPGKVRAFKTPAMDKVRFELGIKSCDSISHSYDPMVAKYVAWGESRELAIAGLRNSIQDTIFLGPKNNLLFLNRLLECQKFQDASFTTKTIQEDFSTYREVLADSLINVLMAATVFAQAGKLQKETGVSSFSNMPLKKKRVMRIGGSQWSYEYEWKNNKTLIIDNEAATIVSQEVLQDYSSMQLEISGRIHQLHFVFQQGANTNDVEFLCHLKNYGNLFATIKSPLPLLQGEKPKGSYCAPMPGKVVKVLVSKGEAVKQGQRMVILEAMKMESEINAHEEGTVEDIFVKNGEQVEMGKTLVQLRGESI